MFFSIRSEDRPPHKARLPAAMGSTKQPKIML
jgi:hypothetical protein